MEWVKLAGVCTGTNDCPNIRQTTQGTIAVQGRIMTDVDAPDGEGVVEIPAEMLVEAAHAIATR